MPAQGEARREGRELLAAVFAALSDPNRLSFLVRLSEQPWTVSELAAATGLSQPRVSQGLSVLRRAGLVRADRTGVTTTYSVTGPEVVEALRLGGVLTRRPHRPA